MLKYWHSHPINLSNPISPQKLIWSMTQLLFLLNTWQNHQKRWGQIVNVIYWYSALIKCRRANNLNRNPLSFNLKYPFLVRDSKHSVQSFKMYAFFGMVCKVAGKFKQHMWNSFDQGIFFIGPFSGYDYV